MIERPHLDKVLGYIEPAAPRGPASWPGAGARCPTAAATSSSRPSSTTSTTPCRSPGTRSSVRSSRRSPSIREEEAIAIANDTNYGLHAAVYTRDLDTAIRAARAIRAGTVSVNALLGGRHHDAVRWLQGVRLRRSRQGHGGLRPVHREEDDLDLRQDLTETAAMAECRTRRHPESSGATTPGV